MSGAVQELKPNVVYALPPGGKNAAHRVSMDKLWFLLTEQKRRHILFICGAIPDLREEFYHTPNNGYRLARYNWEDLPAEWQDKVFNFIRAEV